MNTRKFSGDMADQVEKDRDQLIEMREVMSWCSQNVVWGRHIDFQQESGWEIAYLGRWFTGPTLYEALRTAWEKRDE